MTSLSHHMFIYLFIYQVEKKNNFHTDKILIIIHESVIFLNILLNETNLETGSATQNIHVKRHRTSAPWLMQNRPFEDACLLGRSAVHLRDGGSKHLWNVGQFLTGYAAQHRRQPSPHSSTRESEISLTNC
jgi:hypothetical protein